MVDEIDDGALLRAFKLAALPAERWRHEAHIRIAFLHLREAPFAQALDRLRAGIQRLNAANLVPEGPERGYHETITEAWLRLVHHAMTTHEAAPDSEAFLERHAHLGQKTLLRLFYSRARLLCPEAKARFVEADLLALPRP